MNLRTRLERVLRLAKQVAQPTASERLSAWSHFLETGELSGHAAIDRGLLRVSSFLESSGLALDDEEDSAHDWRETIAVDFQGEPT